MKPPKSAAEPKYRYLGTGETLKDGDEWHDGAYPGQWRPVKKTVGEMLTGASCPCFRRRMTPAEEHAEELLEALRSITGMQAHIADREMRELFIRRVYGAIGKTGGETT